MTRKSAGVPWERVEGYLGGSHDQVWLGHQLGASKQAVTMWKSRGFVPAGYAALLAKIFDVSVSEVVGELPIDSPIRGQKRALSETAEALIFCVMKLDAAGGQGADILAHHFGLLRFAEQTLQVQDGSYELRADEMKRLLQALAEATGS